MRKLLDVKREGETFQVTIECNEADMIACVHFACRLHADPPLADEESSHDKSNTVPYRKRSQYRQIEEDIKKAKERAGVRIDRNPKTKEDAIELAKKVIQSVSPPRAKGAWSLDKRAELMALRMQKKKGWGKARRRKFYNEALENLTRDPEWKPGQETPSKAIIMSENDEFLREGKFDDEIDDLTEDT